MANSTARRAQKTAVQSDHSDPDQLGLERIIFFSDAVFAIAITLLALEIRLPEGADVFSDAVLIAQLLSMWHKYLAFLISFMVIGTFWISHHRKFHFIKRYDTRLMMLNLFMLMVVAFIPFPSSILSTYSNHTATIFYALVMILASLLGAAIWQYASKNDRLIDSHLDKNKRRRLLLTPLITALIFLASIGIAFLNPDAGKFIWLLIIPASIYLNRS